MIRRDSRLAWIVLAAGLMACTAQAAEVKAADISVSGSGSIGIGVMNGGEIKFGLAPDEVRALQKASAKDVVALFTPILARLNAQVAQLSGSAREDKIALGVAEAFLATIKGKKIPTSEWSIAFGEAARNYLRLGASIQATPVTSDKIKDLINEADTARKLGKFDDADAALAEAINRATDDVQRDQQQALKSTRQAANLHIFRANLAFTRLERVKGALLLERAFEIARVDVSPEPVMWLFDAGNAWMTEGRIVDGMRVYTTAQRSAEAALTAEPLNAQWHRILFLGHKMIGEVQAYQGDKAGAINNYQASMTIAERMIAIDPTNTQWQRDLFIIHMYIGDAQGDSAIKLKNYQTSLTIAERLAASNPHSAQWQRDLSSSHLKIGDVHAAQGDDATALKSYQTGLAISERLAASDTRWQDELIVSHERIGNVQSAQGDNSTALKSYQSGLAISERLAASDPRDALLQRTQFIIYNKIGDVRAAQADEAAALKSYQSGLAIVERLAASDPRNTEWQRCLVFSYWKLAKLGEVFGPIEARRTLLKKGLSLLTELRDSGRLLGSSVGWIKAFETEQQKLN